MASACSPAPSGANADALLQLALLPGVGPRTLANLLAEFDSPPAVLSAADASLLAVDGVGPRLVRTIRHADQHVDVAEVRRRCEAAGIAILSHRSESYPRPLRSLPDAPPILFSRGRWLPHDELGIAVVGTRHATPYGRRQAERIAGGLAARGLTIISGLARGIDAVAHTAALEQGGRTVAVLGCGLESVYPPEHAELAQRIADRGAVLSEYPPWAQPRGSMFPQRNRLISGLALAVLVVEAAERSGALITARHAGEQGRDVFSLPGPVTSRNSGGCHQLIRDGARLVESVDQILDELGPLAEELRGDDGRRVRHPVELQLNPQEQAVLDAVDGDATAIDAVVARSRLPVHRVLSTISVLEMRRLLRRLSGQYVIRP